MNDKAIKTHRCKELLEYNKCNFKPCTIRYGTWLPYDNPDWLLYSLETSDEDWDIKYMSYMAKIKYCPWCGKKLEEVDDGNKSDN